MFTLRSRLPVFDVAAPAPKTTTAERAAQSSCAAPRAKRRRRRAIVCGDGFAERKDIFGEECDDGNVTAGDGCSIAADSSCRAQGDLRPASALTLVPSIGDNVLGFGGGDTTGATADLSGTCATTAASPEHVFDRV